ncbi:MAG: Unknown protein [uncultured Thiotrichaceae bacterium]|uniref:LysM domain-containing protein n=1 Tax=uncultured Thiotrichaceae bacterium TaxID=298394 RepID=A0A6S6T0A3_9GAMM|nr:MAG: Unknown protein [uncultured Thiotrichaceae bacterium]
MMNKRILSTALASLFVMQTGFAEKTAQSELDILSAEADEAIAENTQSSTPIVAEPSMEAISDAETDKLSDAVASQLSKILGESSSDVIDAETEDKIEKVISSSLLSGAEMNDIKNAVSSAMTELKSEDGSAISEEKIENATQSIDKLVGSETKTDAAEDSYLSSLRAEADAVNEPAFKETSASVSEEAKPAKSLAKEVQAAAEPEKALTEEKPTKVLVDAVAEQSSTDDDTKESFLNAESVTVLKGESLYKIALRVYGNGGMYARLYDANKDAIIDPNLIRVGQTLKVPR